jgi:hypothetical protein
MAFGWVRYVINEPAGVPEWSNGPAVQPVSAVGQPVQTVSAVGRGEQSQWLHLGEIVNCKHSKLFIEFHCILLCNIFSARSQNSEKRLVVSSCLSVRLSARNNSAPTGRSFMKFDILGFFEYLLRKFKFH